MAVVDNRGWYGGQGGGLLHSQGQGGTVEGGHRHRTGEGRTTKGQVRPHIWKDPFPSASPAAKELRASLVCDLAMEEMKRMEKVAVITMSYKTCHSQ